MKLKKKGKIVAEDLELKPGIATWYVGILGTCI